MLSGVGDVAPGALFEPDPWPDAIRIAGSIVRSPAPIST